MSILETAFLSHNNKINKIEKLKTLETPLEFFEKFESLCNSELPNLQSKEIDYLLRCFGIFKKNHNNFMLRVRIPAGQLDAKQAVTIGELAKTYGENYLDITTRQQLQLRFLKLKDLPTIIKELDTVGLSTSQTASDNVRNIVTSSFDGFKPYSLIVCRTIIEKMEKLFMKNPKYFGTLPRKFNIGILGSTINDCNILGHDCSFVLAQKGEQLGFNLYLGGKGGISALDANIFITEDEVVSLFESIIELYLQYGFRDNRNKNRLFYLLQEVGLEDFINELKEHANREFKTAGKVLIEDDIIFDEIPIVPFDDDISALHFSVPSGILTGSALIQAGYLAMDSNSSIRLSLEQSFYLICKNSQMEFIKNSPLYKKHREFNHTYFNNLISCTGANTCTFGKIESKNEAILMAYFLKDAIELCEAKIRMYWSACSRGCGLHTSADIGYEGCTTKNEEGETVAGVKIYIGGKVTKELRRSRLLYEDVSLDKAREITKALITLYKDKKIDNESFEAFDTRVLSLYCNEALKQEIGI